MNPKTHQLTGFACFAIRLNLATVLMAAILAFAAPSFAAAQTLECVENWSDAATIVKDKSLLKVDELSLQTQADQKGDIVKTTLCTQEGQYVYRLVVRTPSGKLKSITVNAEADD